MLNVKLESFVRVVDCGSFSAAAEQLFISQSALSQQIKLLERQLGFELFDHSSRHAALTAAGQAFYPRAVMLIAQYREAVAQCTHISDAARAQKQRLRLASCRDQYLQIWSDLWPYDLNASSRYEPFFIRYDDQLVMLHAVQQGNADLCIQLENANIAACGLEFMPITALHELCIPGYSSLRFATPSLSIEQLAQYAISFHNHEGETLYEDALRACLRQHYPAIHMMNPREFSEAQLGTPILLLAPSICVPNPQHKNAVPLIWGEGIRIGFALSPHSPRAAWDYAEQMKQAIAAAPPPWI